MGRFYPLRGCIVKWHGRNFLDQFDMPALRLEPESTARTEENAVEEPGDVVERFLTGLQVIRIA
jgi:hypothetical protein